jgi:uncharacterized Zn finger protein
MTTDPGSTLREADTLSVHCPGCGGELRADTEFVRRRGHSMINPEDQEPFWMTTCAACGNRFNYLPGSGEIRRFEP